MWEKCFREAVKQYDVVLVQLKPEHFDYFDQNHIQYRIANPNIDDWESVKKKCIDRGNSEDFIRSLEEVFVPYYEDCLQRNYEKFYILDENQTLESVLIEDDVELRKL